MKWMIENWMLIIVFASIFCITVSYFLYFMSQSMQKKYECIREWLKYAVIEAEKALGEKTGEMKLRMVYDMAIKQFPWILKLINFMEFSILVDEALDWMKMQIVKNGAISNYVRGDKNGNSKAGE